MKKYFIFALCAILSIGLITGCGSKKEDKKKDANKIESCPNCVFAFHTYLDNYLDVDDTSSDDRTKLEDYTTDYTTLKDENGNQRDIFLGYILDDDGIVIRGFLCGVHNNKPFCIEGAKDASKVEYNKKIMNSVFSDKDCEYVIDEYRCSIYENGITYTAEIEDDGEAAIYKSKDKDFEICSIAGGNYGYLGCSVR